VTEIIRCDPAYFFPAGISTSAARYLGPVTMVGSRLLQLIDVSHLLPPELADVLFQQAADQHQDKHESVQDHGEYQSAHARSGGL
jgi:hypothetical protein